MEVRLQMTNPPQTLALCTGLPFQGWGHVTAKTLNRNKRLALQQQTIVFPISFSTQVHIKYEIEYPLDINNSSQEWRGDYYK